MFGAVPDLWGRVPIVSAAQTLVDSPQHSFYVGVQSIVTKRIGTAARSICECTGGNILGHETLAWFGQSGLPVGIRRRGPVAVVFT